MTRLMQSPGNPQSNYKAFTSLELKEKAQPLRFFPIFCVLKGTPLVATQGITVLVDYIYRKISFYMISKLLAALYSEQIKTIRERITVGRLGDPVSAQAVNSLFQRIKVVLDKAVHLEMGHLSHFEVLTAVVFNLFAEENVDIAVIEAGLGGARDATNVLSSSDLAASIITTIGEEHLDALGAPWKVLQ